MLRKGIQKVLNMKNKTKKKAPNIYSTTIKKFSNSKYSVSLTTSESLEDLIGSLMTLAWNKNFYLFSTLENLSTFSRK